jgi:hypothetical protein
MIAQCIRNILGEIVARRGVERRKRRLVVLARDHARPHAAKMTRAFCDDNFMGPALHPPHPLDSPDLASSYLFLFPYLGISETASKGGNSGLEMNFFWESENWGRNQC